MYNVRKRLLLPKIKLYLRGRSQAYKMHLEEADMLWAIYSSETFDDLEEQFIPFSTPDGDVIFFNPEEMVLLAFNYHEERVNETTVQSVEGIAGFILNREEEGFLEARVWQKELPYEDADEVEKLLWYGHLGFRLSDPDASFEYELDSYGPFTTKSAAVDVVRSEFERLAKTVLRYRED